MMLLIKGHGWIGENQPPMLCSREQTGLSAIDTRQLGSLLYCKWLNSSESLLRQNPRVREQRQCRKLS